MNMKLHDISNELGDFIMTQLGDKGNLELYFGDVYSRNHISNIVSNHTSLTGTKKELLVDLTFARNQIEYYIGPDGGFNESKATDWANKAQSFYTQYIGSNSNNSKTNSSSSSWGRNGW
jgi:hypothetical protein